MNRICSLFGISKPIIQGGMIWCSGWELAAAVSNAGGLGLIGAGSMKPEVLRMHIHKCRAVCQNPFGVNIPLISPYAAELIEVVMDEKVSIVFTSAGNPALYTARLKAQGIKVVHVIANTKFALKAEVSGVDAVVAEGFEAGGHNGREETTTMCLIPQICATVNIPVIAAGGIGSGKAMLAAFALGAEGVQIGSAFVVAEESSAHINFKQKILQAKEGDTQLSLKKLTAVRLLKNDFYQQVEEAEQRGAAKEELAEILGRGRSRQGMFEGELNEGELEIGQVSAMLSSIQPAKKIIENILQEFETERLQLSQINFNIA